MCSCTVFCNKKKKEKKDGKKRDASIQWSGGEWEKEGCANARQEMVMAHIHMLNKPSGVVGVCTCILPR